jgi:hypothetical protein
MAKPQKTGRELASIIAEELNERTASVEVYPEPHGWAIAVTFLGGNLVEPRMRADQIAERLKGLYDLK